MSIGFVYVGERSYFFGVLLGVGVLVGCCGRS